VQTLVGGTSGMEALREPTHVEAYLIDPVPVRPDGTQRMLGSFPIVGPAVDVPAATREALSRLLLDGDTYDWQRVKRTSWTPRVGLRFVRDGTRLDLALCLDTDQIVVFRDTRLVHAEDTDPARARLLALLQPLFPDDGYVQGLVPGE
jgi:hypothetical protein